MVPGEPRYERARAAVEEVLPGWFPPRDTAPLPTVAAVENDGRDKRAVARMLAGVADVENDGDRGPRAARDPLSVLDQAADAARAKAVQRLMVAVAALSVDEVAALAWVAGELPGARLRRRCEEATATGWCGSDVTKSPPAGRRTAEDGTRAALLAAWRQVVALVHGARSTASEDLRQRTREDVLADEAQRRARGAK